MKAFGRLLWKDLELSRLPMLINGVAAILWQLFLRTRLQQNCLQKLWLLCFCHSVPATVVCLADVSVLADRVAGR